MPEEKKNQVTGNDITESQRQILDQMGHRCNKLSDPSCRDDRLKNLLYIAFLISSPVFYHQFFHHIGKFW